MTSPLNSIQDKLKAAQAATAAAKTPEVKETAPIAPAPQQPAVELKTFSVYKSSLPNQRIPMPNGRLICITSGKYITDKEDEIEFLDNEIKAGFPYLASAGTMTSEDLDPMISLRRKIIADYLANEAKVPAPVLTTPEVQKVVPNNTGALNKLAGASNSADS